MSPISSGADLVDAGAEFSEGGVYRYRLWRTWDATKPKILFVMLNPSTADANKNDPTVERCQRRAREYPSCGGVEVVNLFAFRATDPKDLISAMKSGMDIIGPKNNEAILAAAAESNRVICAWGGHGTIGGRAARVAAMLRIEGFGLWALELTQAGEPRHPLYLRSCLLPMPWTDRDKALARIGAGLTSLASRPKL